MFGELVRPQVAHMVLLEHILHILLIIQAQLLEPHSTRKLYKIKYMFAYIPVCLSVSFREFRRQKKLDNKFSLGLTIMI